MIIFLKINYHRIKIFAILLFIILFNFLIVCPNIQGKHILKETGKFNFVDSLNNLKDKISFSKIYDKNVVKNKINYNYHKIIFGRIIGLLIGLLFWPVALLASIPISLILLTLSGLIAFIGVIMLSSSLIELSIISFALATIPFYFGILSFFVGLFFPFLCMIAI